MPAAQAAAPNSRAKPLESGQGSVRNRKLRAPKKTRAGWWLVLMLFLFVESLFYAWCRVQCVDTGFAIDRQTRRHEALLKERNTLNIELARLKSPGRIETIARTRLGLVRPAAQQTVRLP
ncbi:cell division protein FtsL [Desulfosarcina ovata]|uniref:Cell division protein FtsL n=1 Tax=Desulfosarcina ovata subsp. ovata TaxID=2752305 RepID=A0A5K8AIB8_9BACT|nr:cell division protein FtsL [Desulfosarcina ovata]BBO91630.1 hypothetical protein DSCOOX_48100 [Desulfosarcina ovata subsp. ovata]